MPNVLITPATLAGLDGPHLKILRDAGFTVSYPRIQAQLSEDELLEQLGDTVGTIAGSEPYTRRVLAAHPALRVVARAGVGYDAVDLDACTDHGVAVTVRDTRGREIDGACGQLAATVTGRSVGPARRPGTHLLPLV